MVLQDVRELGVKKDHLILKHTAALNFLIKPFIKEYVAIEIYNKPQPVILRISGNRGDICVAVSNTNKYPDDVNN